MAAEAGHFTIGDALEAINEKLIRRHPHVFGDGQAETEAEVRKLWSEIKASEKKDSRSVRGPAGRRCRALLPALVEAQQISSRAAQRGLRLARMSARCWPSWTKSGRSWPRLTTAAEREHETRGYVVRAREPGAVLKVDPEQALRRTNAQVPATVRGCGAGAGGEREDAGGEPISRRWRRFGRKPSRAVEP